MDNTSESCLLKIANQARNSILNLEILSRTLDFTMRKYWFILISLSKKTKPPNIINRNEKVRKTKKVGVTLAWIEFWRLEICPRTELNGFVA